MFCIVFHILVVIGSGLLVVALVCPAQEVEITVDEVGIEQSEALIEGLSTVVEVAVAGIA